MIPRNGTLSWLGSSNKMLASAQTPRIESEIRMCGTRQGLTEEDIERALTAERLMGRSLSSWPFSRLFRQRLQV